MPETYSLRELLIDEMQDLYHAEKQLVKALPKLAKAASNSELKKGIESHLKQTQTHVERLERGFRALGEKPKAKVCHAMEGLVDEGAEAIELEGPDPVRDAAIIGAAQRVEHYEIAAYGTARAFAEKVGEDRVAALLQETLDEDGETNKQLTEVAAIVNDDALAAAAEDK
jgi:ferritin-like metal-binding protein YciE